MAKLSIGPEDALVIVDVQNDFLPGGALAVPEGDQVIDPINRIIDQFRLVIATQDWHPVDHKSFQEQGGPWPRHCVQGTPGADLSSRLKQEAIHKYIRKGVGREGMGYSPFENPEMETTLREHNIQRLFVTGLATNYCVRATALDARQRGFEVVVLTDAVRGIDDPPGAVQKALEEMRTLGASLATTDDLEKTPVVS